jgi:hypothetical protein
MSKSKVFTVRDVDPEVVMEFKAAAVKEGLPMGKALTQAMEVWRNLPRRKPKRSMAAFKPFKGPKGTERLSEEIDKVLYGGD